MRRSVSALLLIACLRHAASADPASPASPHDRDGRHRAPPADSANLDSGPNSPWIDQAPAPVFEGRHVEEAASRRRKRNAALILGGLYVGFAGWTYAAWYRKPARDFRWGGDVPDGSPWYDWFDTRTYAAGADKLGHTWATLGLARLGTEILNQYGGYDRLPSAIVATALSEALFLAVEIKDGYHYSFSFGDLSFNTAGALLAFAQSMSPRVDELVDFRVQYFPSKAYRRLWESERNVDWAEDYTGQTYLLALHLGALPGVLDARWDRWAGWARFVDVAVGFDTRGYKPDPPWRISTEMPDYDKRQRLFFGVTLNGQGVFDALLGGRGGKTEKLRKFTHATFEVFNVPFTTLPLVEDVRVPTGDVPNDGA